jgi:Protein of unknown function (DUF4012)
MPARRGRRRRRATRSLGIAAVALLVVAVPAGWQLQASADRVRDDLTLAKRLLGQASTAGPASLARREALLRAAQPAITDARTQLRSWPLRQLGAVPLLGRDVRLASAATAGAEQTAGAALAVVDALSRIESGRLTGATLTATADAFQHLADVSADQAKWVRAKRPLLLDRQRREFLAGANQAARTAGQITQVLRLAARMYGSPRPAHLFLGFQNPAELRGTGGLIGQYGILQGSPSGPRLITVESYDTLNQRAAGLAPRPGPAGLYRARADGVPNIWSSVNLAPHLPKVGRDLVELYRRTVGPPLDAVVLIDPLAVAGILKISGPFDAAGSRITATNVVDRTLIEAYVRFADDRAARRRFLADVAHQTFASLRRGLERDPEGLVRALAAAARGRHLQLYAVDIGVEQALLDLGLAGSAAPPAYGDYLLPVGVNTAGNKLDAFLRRELRYAVTLDADGGARAAVEIELRNSVRPSRLPAYVVGPYDRRFRAGEHRVYQVLYVAGDYAFSRATLNRHPVLAEARRDVGALTLAQQVRIPAGRTVTLGYKLERAHAAELSGRWMRYRLLLRPQATIWPDSLEVVVRAPDGWRFVGLPAGTRVDRSSARWSGLLDHEWTMTFLLERSV